MHPLTCSHLQTVTVTLLHICVLAYVAGNNGSIGDLVAKGAEEPAKEKGTYVAKSVIRDRIRHV